MDKAKRIVKAKQTRKQFLFDEWRKKNPKQSQAVFYSEIEETLRSLTGKVA